MTTESVRSVYVPIAPATALRLVTQVGLSLQEKLETVTSAGKGIVGAKSRETAEILGGLLQRLESFVILQIQIDENAMLELGQRRLLQTPCDYCTILSAGVEYLAGANVYVGMAVSLELHHADK